jgi:hypothetical protein
MDTANRLAAQAAGERAQQCQRRAAQLASRQPVRPEDVRFAHAALNRAIVREVAARDRLRNSGRPALTNPRLREARGHADLPDPAVLGRRARTIDPDELYETYFALGGWASALDVDAFIHELLELPASEVAVLGQAVWELTELRR